MTARQLPCSSSQTFQLVGGREDHRGELASLRSGEGLTVASNTGMDDDERQALRAEGLDPDDPAVVATIDFARWEHDAARHAFLTGSEWEGHSVQILASALPGFRDLRAPLIAGYLWLFFLWILIKPDIKTRPTNAVAGAVYDLAKDAGPIWIGLGVGVAAYLVGSVSQALSPLLSPLPGETVSAVWGRLPAFMEDRLIRRGLLPRIIAEYERDPVQQILDEDARKFPDEQREVVKGFKFAGPRLQKVLTRASEASKGLESDLQLPATLLLAERGREPDPQLFSEADRLKAERELRLAVVPPLSAIAIFLGWNQSWWWLALIPVGVLLWQAHSRNLDFRSLMLGAMGNGLARSRSVEEFKRWIDSIPAPSAEESRPGGEDAP